jgi:DNA-binding transcriptional LysR family regulator
LGEESLYKMFVHIQFRMSVAPRGSGRVYPAAIVVKDQEVAFERLESALLCFPSGAHQVFNAAHRGFVDQLSVEQMRLGRANDAAPRPVNRDLLAHRAIVLAGTSRLQASRTAGLLSGQDTLTVATLEQKVAMQIAGLGTGWIPAPVAQAHLANGSLISRRIAEPRAAATLHYAWRRNDRGKSLQWWLERLDLPRVQSRLIGHRRSSSTSSPRPFRRSSR